LAACNPRPDTGPVVASALGGASSSAGSSAPSAAERLFVDATAQGLVRFDAAGQIEAGLAERWTVIDGGMTYIFRLRAATWSDGTPVTAEEVAALLRRQTAPGSRNPLAPFLSAIEAVVVMTPQVIEVRLARPRPDLLKLFAQPELGLLRTKPIGGTGPFRVATRTGASVLLRPVADRARTDPDDPRRRRPEEDVRLIGERAARAIARFAAHRSDLVAGGSFVDWPLLAADGDVAPANIRIDPAAGLFGLAVASRDGFLAEPAHRAAVAEAIDAGTVTAAVSAGWTPVDTLLPEGSDSGAPPARPSWAVLPPADRLAEARTQVRAWQGGPVALRVAMPRGPGATLVYGAVAASLGRIGVTALRVGPAEPAELRLVDAVAPYDSARWYLATACQPCGEAARGAIDAARDAPTLAERAARLATADRALADDVAFIPLARPLRWSLVALRLRQWQPNARAWHPLNRLRAETTY
jgi:peptide/nickel transport system substrate-binding protein